MKLSELPFGAPFRWNGRVFYKVYPHTNKNGMNYTCYEVVGGFIRTPTILIPADFDVIPYFDKNGKKQP